jgi:sugar/nucleoside kinase (ribokinase family)
MNNNKLTIFGSARADAFLSIPEGKVTKECNLDTKRCVIELSYAAKIPLDGVIFCVGGNGANVAVGTHRLKVESTLVAEVGEGIMADYVMRELGKEISLERISQTNGVPAGFGAVLSYQGERTIMSYYPPERPAVPSDLVGSEWAYLTSTGEDFEEYFEQIYDWIIKNNVKLAFNPGGRQIAKGKEWLGKYLAVTELLLVNREEAEEIVGMNGTAGKEKELLDAVFHLGCKRVVVTDGGVGAFAWDGKDYLKIGIIPRDAVERTGAGDAFSTGCLSALIQGENLEVGMMWGTCNSTSVILKVGPEDGLLNMEGINKWMEEANNANVKVDKF